MSRASASSEGRYTVAAESQATISILWMSEVREEKAASGVNWRCGAARWAWAACSRRRKARGVTGAWHRRSVASFSTMMRSMRATSPGPHLDCEMLVRSRRSGTTNDEPER